MENCPVCDNGRLITKIASSGEEKYCQDCRRIVASASLGFIFTAAGEEGVVECKGPEGDPRPGLKGPGKKARCFLYTEGNQEEEQRARQKAKDSAYAFQHKKAAFRIINATKIVEAMGYFTGGPASMSSPNAGAPMGGALTSNPMLPGNNPTNPLAQGAHPNPMPPTAQPGRNPMGVGGTGAAGEVPAAPGGIQPGNLNGANPLNSGTTASRRLAELISEEMGPMFCTKHMSHECGCKAD